MVKILVDSNLLKESNKPSLSAVYRTCSEPGFIPNIALDDVPVGNDKKSNKLIEKFGNIKKFSFKPKSHIEIGIKNNQIDFDTSIKLSGSRFVVLKSQMALLERALINFIKLN